MAQLKFQREVQEQATRLWKALVTADGRSKAKDMMRRIMGDKKPGPPGTNESLALKRNCGRLPFFTMVENGSDREIAKHIFESDPYYVQRESGCVSIVNNDYTDDFMDLPDDPVTKRWPVNKTLKAIEKIVERQRRWEIKEYLLPKDCAPRPYRRD